MLKNYMLLILLLLTRTALAADAEKWYQIEVLIFDQITPSTLNAEQWPDYPGSPNLTDVRFLQARSRSNAEHSFVKLPRHLLTLRAVDNRLDRRSTHNILAHFAWRQPVVGKKQSVAVYLSGGEDFTELRDTTNWSGNKGQHLWQLEGTITVSLAKYLHTAIDLLVRAPVRIDYRDHGKPHLQQVRNWHQTHAFFNSPFSLKTFRIQQTRRMRSKKLYYIDHPLLGILVEITPVKAPAPPQAPAHS